MKSNQRRDQRGRDGASWATALTTAAGSEKALMAANTVARSDVGAAASSTGTTMAAIGWVGGTTAPGGGVSADCTGVAVVSIVTSSAIVPASGTGRKL